MSNIQVYDQFLKEDDFKKLDRVFCQDVATWHYNDHAVYPHDESDDTDYNFQFVHSVYRDCQFVSEHHQLVYPILANLDAKVMLRMKFNLGIRTPNIVEREFHQDHYDVLPEDVPYKVAIFYLNTNNGYTLFETGDKVESVANRIVIFDGKLKHCGTTCTNSKTRVVLNINYI